VAVNIYTISDIVKWTDICNFAVFFGKHYSNKKPDFPTYPHIKLNGTTAFIGKKNIRLQMVI